MVTSGLPTIRQPLVDSGALTALGMLSRRESVLLESMLVMQLFPQVFHDQTDEPVRNGIRH
jgi:hypothetical protein